MATALNYFYPHGHEKHYSPGHPERPERVDAVLKGLREAGWWEGFPQLDPVEIDEQILFGVHSPEYINVLRSACERGAFLDADTYTTPASWDLALNAAGGGIAVTESVWGNKPISSNSQVLRGFSITRPPGHHATRYRGMGFCLLNNVALAAEYLITKKGAKKVAIVDFDLHHGNGTQDIFWSRDDVFYISTHQSPLYPGTGNQHEIGTGDGEGYTANFPLPPGTGDEGFKTITEEFIIPIIDRFTADIILVSYGFDTHWRDPLGYLQLSARGYAGMIQQLCNWADQHCDGKVALFLEGGYDLEAGTACSRAAAAALLGEPYDDSLGPSPRPEGNSWRAVARTARQIWSL